MAGLDTFSNPFETSAGRNPSVIGSGRGRNGNDNNGIGRVDGHSPTSLSELQPSRAGGDPAAILIRKLPISTSKQTLRTMFLFSRECDGFEFVKSSPADQPFATAIARFRSSEGAHHAKELLNGSPMDDGPELKVEIINLTPGGSVGAPWLVDGAGLDGNGHRVGNRFQQADRASPRGNENGRGGVDGSLDGVSPTFGSAHLTSQSPAGHGAMRGRVSGLSVIQQDETDDETNRIMDDPGSFLSPENNHHHHHLLMQQGRRATAPTLPSGMAERLGALSLNAAVGSPNGLVSPPAGSVVASPRGYGGPSMFRVGEINGMQHYSRGSVSNATSPTSRFPPGIHNSVGYGGRLPYLPPVNPADQNPPCNTLYVGNLPLDTSEDELKTLFSKQRGYKRLCFRTKQNGPMCFVEFEEIQWATRALNELYGVMLSNSVRGGIRLSFSKNPLGVRGPPQQSPASPGPVMHGAGSLSFGSGSMSPGYTAMNSPAFSTASGPPPGLPTPHGYQTGRNPGSAVTGAFAGPREGRNGAFGAYY